MSELRTAALRALEFIRWSQFVPCQSGDFPEPPSTAPQVEADLVAALAAPNHDYERGFVDGMLEQAKRSVDKAVNAMPQWRGCQVCGIGRVGNAYGYVCPRGDCPMRVTCGGAV